MRGDFRRMLFAAASLSFCAAFIAVSCGPLGGDDDPEVGESDNSGVVRSTYTPTVPNSTPESVKERAAAQTAAVQTATEMAVNPPPATAVAGGPQPGDNTPSSDGSDGESQPSGTTQPNPENPSPIETQTGEADLTPPDATLTAGSNTIDGTLGGYIWLFNDPLGSVGYFPSSPLMGLTDIALTIAPGVEAELAFSGEALEEPPTSVTLDLYDFDENTAVPQSTSGQVAGDGSLVFGPKTDPITTLELQDGLSFTADFPPGHYILFAHADWPDPEELVNSEIPNSDVFVAYTFHIIVE